MNLQALVKLALEQKASDLHLEPGLNITIRANGTLKRLPQVASPDAVDSMVRQILNSEERADFQSRGSFDTTKVLLGVNCRINVMKTDRGSGLAIRILTSSSATLRNCNLHPQLAQLVQNESGLILFSGPTGSGKSTTMAALLEEINSTSNRHIITLESPIEYRLQPKKSLIRQREVGVHTPSFEQGLMDCLREDPDVIVVGEMREAEAMRLTLSAAETGHLVMATLHGSNSADAVYRMMMSFPPERQGTVLAQLADSLLAIITQKMTYREDQILMVPTLEILIASHAVKNAIRKGEASKLISLLQAGGPDGSWTFERYATWLDQKREWIQPEPPSIETADLSDTDFVEDIETEVATPAPRASTASSNRKMYTPPPELESREPNQAATGRTLPPRRTVESSKRSVTRTDKEGRIEIPDLDFDLDALAAQVAKSVKGDDSDA